MSKKSSTFAPAFEKEQRSLQIESPLGRNASDSDIPTEEREHGVALYEGFTRSRASRSSREGAVVQLVRIPACHAVGREFESRPHRKKRNFSFESLRFFVCVTETRTLRGPRKIYFVGRGGSATITQVTQ